MTLYYFEVKDKNKCLRKKNTVIVGWYGVPLELGDQLARAGCTKMHAKMCTAVLKIYFVL